MGNSQAKGQVKARQKKQVHWKSAERPGPPGKPELVSPIEATPDVVTIKWDKPRRDGGTPIVGYLVEHRRTGSPHWVRATPLMVPQTELTLSGLEPGWRYQFRVTAQNAVGMSDPGEVSEPLTVTLQRSVITAPKFTEELIDTTALENEMAEFVVHVIGQPPPKISWFKDGFEIFSSRRTRIITENDKSVLTIHQVSLTDEGEIKCTATNKAGHVSTKSTVKVEAPPVIRLPRNYEDGLLFELDEVIRLKVSLAGRPQPLIFWSHNGETIQSNDRYEITDTDKSSILKIAEAKRSDRGEYQIKAVNKLGEDFTSFLVTVTDKPRPPKDLKVIMSLGKTVTLSWGIPEDDGGCKIGNYIVEYYRLGWNVWLKASTCRQLTTTLSELIEGSEYKFRVKAESPYGVSDPSDETDVIFIPDPKRGLLHPPPRSRSQPRDVENERTISPVPPKRRSTSSTRPQQREQTQNTLIPAGLVPTAPKRGKIKSPQRSPESSPLATRKYMFDRSSLARELSYGSPPDDKYKKPHHVEQKSLTLPAENRTPSPIITRAKSPSLIPAKEPIKDMSTSLLPPKELMRDRSPSLVNKLLLNKQEPFARGRSPSKINQLLPENGPIPRERSPSIINTFFSNILPQKRSASPSPSPSPPQKHSPIAEHKESEKPTGPKDSKESKEPKELNEPKEPSVIDSLKGDHLDRLSPSIVHRRLSSPMIDTTRDKSPSPRNRSPSLVENLIGNTNLNTSEIDAPRSKSPSPNPRRSPSPSRYSIGDDMPRRESLHYTNDLTHGSSEFMLVLVDDQDEGTREFYMFEDTLIPPPLSLSAPELGAESELFMPLKTSVSSTEILHERTFARFAKEAEESRIANVSRKSSFEKDRPKISVLEDRRQSIPKILINSKDNEEIVGLERKSSFKRRLSAGASSLAQQISWAKRRHSLRNNTETSDLYEIRNKFSERVKERSRERSISEEKEEETRTNNHETNNSTKYETNRQSSLEESIYSESESEDERLKFDLTPPQLQPQEEETYHPRRMVSTNTSKYEEPFEILSKPLPMPDPNVIPKPILKRKEKKSPEKPQRKFLNREERPSSPIPSSSVSSLDRSRSPSPSPSRTFVKEPSPVPVQMRNIQESQMMKAAEAAKEKRLRRQSSEEEYKVVAEYYMDIVREYGGPKKPAHNLYLNRDSLKAAAESEDSLERSQEEIKQPEPQKEPSPVRTSSLLSRYESSRAARRNPSPCPPRRPMPEPDIKLDPKLEQKLDLKIEQKLEKQKTTRSRSSSRTRTRDTSATRTRNTSKTRRETSATRKDSSTVRAGRETSVPRTITRDLSATRTGRSSKRDTSATRTKRREISKNRTISPTILQEKLNSISRTPSPRPWTPEQLQIEADVKVRSSLDYLTDLAMFFVACWLYLFKDARLAIPILIIMVYRQLKDEIKNMMPKWMTRNKNQ